MGELFAGGVGGTPTQAGTWSQNTVYHLTYAKVTNCLSLRLRQGSVLKLGQFWTSWDELVTLCLGCYKYHMK